MIRLHLVSLISLLLPYGFRTNLVPTERSIRGESNAVGCKTFGEELVEDVGYYREMSRLAQIRDISAFLFRTVVRWTSPLRVKCSPSILSRFWSGLECFGGLKGGFASVTSRFWVFVSCNSCCEAGEWLQAWYIDGQEAYFDCDSRIPYIPCMERSSSSGILQEIPPSLSCLRLEDLESLVGSCIGLQSEPQL